MTTTRGHQLEMIRDLENVRHYRTRTGEIVVIKINEDGTEIDVSDERGQGIGSIELSEEDGDCLLIVYAGMDKQGDRFKHLGIASEALRFLKAHYGVSICARDNDGIQRDDGSHLTGFAVGLIAKMREEGVVEPGSNDFDDGDL
jgi:hypothetical protein